MSGMVRNSARAARDTNRTSDSLSTNSMGRLAEKFHGFKSALSMTQCRNDSDSDMDDERLNGPEVLSRNSNDNYSEPSTSNELTESDSSDSDGDQHRTDVLRNTRKQQLLPVRKGKQLMCDTSGNTDVSSSTASASSDSECDDSFDTNDQPTSGRRVQFSNVSMRTYSLVLGETQASKSYPISLDWAHTPTKTIDITLFELLYSSSRKSACSPNPGKVVRGFRLPRRLRSAQRLELLSTVTGQKPEDIYESNLARITREMEYIPKTACCSDDGYVELRNKAYQMIDADEYVQVVI
jgi:hypothetical protein